MVSLVLPFKCSSPFLPGGCRSHSTADVPCHTMSLRPYFVIVIRCMICRFNLEEAHNEQRKLVYDASNTVRVLSLKQFFYTQRAGDPAIFAQCLILSCWRKAVKCDVFFLGLCSGLPSARLISCQRQPCITYCTATGQGHCGSIVPALPPHSPIILTDVP
jgi:hypothetical protein